VKEVTECVLEQGKALVRAIEALETVEAAGPVERVQAWFLLEAYRRRLWGLVEVAPPWATEEMLSASERIGSERAAVWMSED
jgi:hypothetical protein